MQFYRFPCTLLVSVALATGCSAETDPAVDCTDLATSQSLSEPCCPEHGVDACGAGLFCAAFDGREQPTCYAEYGRADREECTEDRQCTSRACNTEAGNCKSTPYTSCEAAIGCGSDQDGDRFACTADETCEPVGEGNGGEVCERDDDCASGLCSAAKRCLSAAGEDCEWAFADPPLNPSDCSDSSACWDSRPNGVSEYSSPDDCSYCAAGDAGCAPGLKCLFARYQTTYSFLDYLYCAP